MGALSSRAKQGKGERRPLLHDKQWELSFFCSTDLMSRTTKFAFLFARHGNLVRIWHRGDQGLVGVTVSHGWLAEHVDGLSTFYRMSLLCTSRHPLTYGHGVVSLSRWAHPVGHCMAGRRWINRQSFSQTHRNMFQIEGHPSEWDELDLSGVLENRRFGAAVKDSFKNIALQWAEIVEAWAQLIELRISVLERLVLAVDALTRPVHGVPCKISPSDIFCVNHILFSEL